MKHLYGLTKAEVENARARYGSNIITPPKGRTFWQTYISRYDDPIIIILLLALGVNICFTFFGKVEWHECIGIFVSVMISTFVSAFTEHSNENTFQKLREEAGKTYCKVYRDGFLTELPIGELVVGDCVLLQAGDMVPADGHIMKGRAYVNQASLNGESKEAEKYVHKGKQAGHTDFWDPNCVYRGSLLCSGECEFLIDKVGDQTVYGQMTQETQTEPRESPLSIKLAALAKSISKFGYISAILLMAVMMMEDAVLANHCQKAEILAYLADGGAVFSDLVNALIMGIIVIVVAVPEGLPLMIAIVCSLNMKKMLKSNVLVRKIIGIETAGNLHILFSDKTGTLTKGNPEVMAVYDAFGGSITCMDEGSPFLQKWLSMSMVLNSSARMSGKKIIGGNSTEKALLRFTGMGKAKVLGVTVEDHLPFSSDKKFSAVKINGEERGILVKGAPEMLLSQCTTCFLADGRIQPFTDHKKIEKTMRVLSEKAVRLLVLAACKEDAPLKEGLPSNLIFLGLVAIRDEVRPEVKHAIYEMQCAGIQTVMITGDKKETAVAVAKEAGLISDEQGQVLTSKELAKLTDEQVKALLPRLRVLARALPTDKSRLVAIAQACNLVVGMTGDGVNDAPALKRADVGFAMGSGSEVAKEAGDIVILDDNFLSIRNAVLYGRTIYNSIKKFVKFQLTINVAAVTVSVLGPIVGIEKPLNISQMIWTNLMIDSLAAIAFGAEPALRAYLREKPKQREEPILDRAMWSAIIVDGLYICALSLFFFISPWVHQWFRQGVGDIYYYTGYFTFFIFICIFNAFNTRTESLDLLEHLSLNKLFLLVMGCISVTQVFMTYFGGAVIRTAGLNLKEWVLVLSLALTIFPVDILRKLSVNRIHGKEKEIL